MGCDQKFGCHSCQNSLKAFIEVAEQAIELQKIHYIELALKELKSAAELARIIAYASENKEG